MDTPRRDLQDRRPGDLSVLGRWRGGRRSHTRLIPNPGRNSIRDETTRPPTLGCPRSPAGSVFFARSARATQAPGAACGHLLSRMRVSHKSRTLENRQRARGRDAGRHGRTLINSVGAFTSAKPLENQQRRRLLRDQAPDERRRGRLAPLAEAAERQLPIGGLCLRRVVVDDQRGGRAPHAPVEDRDPAGWQRL